MKAVLITVTLAVFLIFCGAFLKNNDSDWISLFDGKSLDNWKVGASASTFRVEDGMIVVNGETAHLFYEGDVMNHDFKNFEFDTLSIENNTGNSTIRVFMEQNGYEVVKVLGCDEIYRKKTYNPFAR